MSNILCDPEEAVEIDKLIKELTEKSNAIILYNDDVNSFDHVISCLQKYCKHSNEQAQQCALIVHNNGRCSIKEGNKKDLKPICEALLENQLSAVIE
jgi:ATP-dependent Clp protease adaptor protein ClpS